MFEFWAFTLLHRILPTKLLRTSIFQPAKVRLSIMAIMEAYMLWPLTIWWTKYFPFDIFCLCAWSSGLKGINSAVTFVTYSRILFWISVFNYLSKSKSSSIRKLNSYLTFKVLKVSKKVRTYPSGLDVLFNSSDTWLQRIIILNHHLAGQAHGMPRTSCCY